MSFQYHLHTISDIPLEGVLDGVPFFANAVNTISFLIGEGSHSLDFWALSSYGDSSTHFIENYYVDTMPPQIDAELFGILGDNNWFVSDTTLVVFYSDPVPGSGLASNSASANSTPIDVSIPITFPEGVYNLTLDVRDTAGLSTQILYTLMVDTTAPALNADQPPTESDIYMNGSVIFTGTSSDATSGVNRIEVAPDGVNWQPATLNPDGSWILDWDSSVKSDSTYTPLVASTDNAGNRTEITLQPITLDNSAPAMSVTGAWYIWESGHIVVYDSRSGIKRIELSVRDEQNRWPAREWDFDTDKLEMDLQWDRKFGDGTIAPIGDYQVLLQAWDKLGNGRWISGRIYIPEAGATAEIPLQGIIFAGEAEPTSTPLPDATEPPTSVGGSDPQPDPTIMPTSTMEAVPISAGDEPSAILASADNSSTNEAPANTTPLTNGILWGAAALAAGAAAALVSQKQLEETRKKEQAKLDAQATERMIQRWSNVVASYGGTYDVEADRKRIAEKEKFWNDYRIASQKKYLEQLRLEEKTALEETAKRKALAKAAQLEEQDYAECMRLIASTGGRVINDLSPDQYNDFVLQSPGAAKAAYMYYESQKAASEATQTEVREYSNQVKTFREGEAESIKSYDNYLAEEQAKSERMAAAAFATLTDKMSRDEENTEDKNVFQMDYSEQMARFQVGETDSAKSYDQYQWEQKKNDFLVSPFLPDAPGSYDAGNYIYPSGMSNPGVGLPPLSTNPISSSDKQDIIKYELGILNAAIYSIEYNRYANMNPINPGDEFVWEDMRQYNNQYDVDVTAAKLEQYTGRVDNATAHAIDDLYQDGNDQFFNFSRSTQEIQLYRDAITNKQNAVADVTRVQGSYDTFRARAFNPDFESVNDIGTAASYLLYAGTGNETFKTTGEIGEGVSVVTSASTIARNANAAGEALRGGAQWANIWKGATFVSKASGVLAIGLGGYTAITSGYEAYSYAQSGETRMAWSKGLESFSGGLALAGGITMLVPGAQPIALVLLAASGIVSVASLVVENWPAIQNYFETNGGIKPVSEEVMSHYTNATSMTSTGMSGYHATSEIGAPTSQGVADFKSTQNINSASSSDIKE
ncbi:MAG: Ig-like domain repeat protein [Anaerolineaceae bacterium]|nr:Ig-like domain repeat protein [Anaerolineaceae bacterium]